MNNLNDNLKIKIGNDDEELIYNICELIGRIIRNVKNIILIY